MSNDSDPLISIRDMAQRSGVASSTLRYYEKLGLIASEREGSSESEHRRYRESTFLKIRYITSGQRAKLRAHWKEYSEVQPQKGKKR
jgi:MerR family redox-sensitive transcriptional activator SoxR